MKQLWAPWRMTYIDSDPTDSCVLCVPDMEANAVARHIVEQTTLTFTILNHFPYSSGHVMVVPRRHALDLGSLSPEESQAFFTATQVAVAALTEAFHPDGFNIGINQGPAAGSSIEHLHLHVVPRWEGDTNFMPVIGDTKVLPEALEATAVRLRQAYTSLKKDAG